MTTHGVTVEHNVSAAMRDNVRLAADVYRPDDGARYPALLCRTPYDKTSQGLAEAAAALAARGYVVVAQDIRGRYASEGKFHWAHTAEAKAVETEDGYDSVEWAASLAHVDGRVGTWGHSYNGLMSWRTASSGHPALVGMLSSGITVRHTDVNHGIFEIGRRLQWMYVQAADARRRAGDPFGPHKGPEAAALWHQMERGKWLWRVPLESIPDDVFSTLAPRLKSWFRTQHIDPWQLDAVHPQVRVPTCTVTGWWDRFIDAVDHFTGVETCGPAALRGRHRLVVGPWNHGLDSLGGRKLAVGPHGPYEPVEANAYSDLVADFYDPLVKDVEPRAGDAPVRVFILNRNAWLTSRTWPLEGATPMAFHLRGGHANTPLGDGRLTRDEASGEEAPDRFLYDPADPVMSLMGINAQAAQCDQAPLGRRQDVLVYQTAPLDEDMLVVGPVCCTLWAATDGVETDFTAKLIEVAPNGVATNLTYGITRTRYLEGFDKVVLLEPDEPVRIDIRMGACGILFRKGSRVRLDISSSDFPAFDRNHNTGRDYWSDPQLRPAWQTVFHDSRRPSVLTLPVLERG